jgi:hypothetical protein
MERGARWGLAVVALAALWAPAARAESSVVMFDDAHPEQAIRSDPSRPVAATVPQDNGGVRVESWSDDGQDFITFFPRYGEQLAPGVYDRAGTWSSSTDPGINVQGATCSQGADGRFEVRDIARDGGGAITRLWVLWEQRCLGYPQSHWGEVRMNEPAQTGGAQAVPSAVRWPATDFARGEIAVPVTFIAPAGGTSFGAASLAGDQPQDFAITGDGCAGAQLAAGATCRVLVRFTQTGPGTKLAHLRVPEAGGTVHDVPLQGYTYGGTTRLTLHSPPGEPVGGGRDWLFDPSTANMGADGDAGYVQVGVVGDTTRFDGTFQAPDAGLQTGRHYSGQLDGVRSSDPSWTAMSLFGNGRTCNGHGSWTVDDATYDDRGAVSGFQAGFEQVCHDNNTDQPPLTGTIAWRANNTTPPAPWMRGGPALPADAFAGAGTVTPGNGAASSAAGATARRTATALSARLRSGLRAGRRLRFTLPAGRLRVGWRDSHGHVLARGVCTWKRLRRQTVVLRLTRRGRHAPRRPRVRLTATFRPAVKGAPTTTVARTLRVRR